MISLCLCFLGGFFPAGDLVVVVVVVVAVAIITVIMLLIVENAVGAARADMFAFKVYDRIQ